MENIKHPCGSCNYHKFVALFSTKWNRDLYMKLVRHLGIIGPTLLFSVWDSKRHNTRWTGNMYGKHTKIDSFHTTNDINSSCGRCGTPRYNTWPLNWTHRNPKLWRAPRGMRFLGSLNNLQPGLEHELSPKRTLVTRHIADFYALQMLRPFIQDNESLWGYYRTYVDHMAKHLYEYIIVAVGGEVRHWRLDTPALDGNTNKYYTPVSPHYDCWLGIDRMCQDCEWLKTIRRSDREDAQVAAVDYWNNRHSDMWDYFQHLLFNYEWRSAFGGIPWGKVARLGAMFWHGHLRDVDQLTIPLTGNMGMTPELFLDQAFTLEHHGGYIFDKSKAFYKYEEKEHIKYLLDEKRVAKRITDMPALLAYMCSTVRAMLYHMAKENKHVRAII